MSAPTDQDATGRHASRHIVVRDGTRLAIDIFFPPAVSDGGPHPVIFGATKYQRRRVRGGKTISMLDDVPALRRLRESGYVIAILDIRGTGASFGVLNAYDLPYAAPFRDDLADVLDWLGHQPWCNGRIGMYGYSFVAGTQLAAALTRSPWLKCIAPQQVAASAHRGFMNLGGIQNLSFRKKVDDLLWRLNVTEPAVPVDTDTDGTLLAAAVAEHRRMKPSTPALLGWHFADSRAADQHGCYDIASLWPQIAETAIPILHVGGWRDFYADETLRLYETLRSTNPSFLVMGTWPHGAQERCPIEEGFDLSDTLLAFYDRYLKLADVTEDRLRPIRYRVLGRTGNAAWRTATAWPPPHRLTRLYPAAQGILSDAAPDDGADAYQVDYGTGTADLATRYTRDRGEENYAGLADQGLTYISLPLTAGAIIAGAPVLSLRLSSNAPDCDIFAYLLRVTPDGVFHAITEGFLRLSNRREGPSPYADFGLPNHPCLESGQELFPDDGRCETVRIAMLPTAQGCDVGDRLALAMICSDANVWNTPVKDPPPTITVAHGWDTALILPILNDNFV